MSVSLWLFPLFFPSLPDAGLTVYSRMTSQWDLLFLLFHPFFTSLFSSRPSAPLCSFSSLLFFVVFFSFALQTITWPSLSLVSAFTCCSLLSSSLSASSSSLTLFYFYYLVYFILFLYLRYHLSHRQQNHQLIDFFRGLSSRDLSFPRGDQTQHSIELDLYLRYILRLHHHFKTIYRFYN